MASPSCEANAEDIVNVDRFSSLPEDIAHAILSLISFKDLTRVGGVSKRCRRFSLSCPSLNFCQFSDVDLSTCEMRKRVLDSLERFLIQRADNQIQCLRFRWFNHVVCNGDEDNFDMSDCYCDYASLRLSAWIDSAVRCNVEEVHLAITSQDLLDNLPTSLFLCGSLRSLFVDMMCMIRDVPSLDIFSNLESVTLKNVWICGEGLWKWISNCCKFIKELHIENVDLHNVTIESSSLESFCFYPGMKGCSTLNISGDKIEKIHINGAPTESCNFSAPNLKILEWTGSFVGDHNHGELLCLERAQISSYFGVHNFDALVIFLRTICRVKVLILTEEIVKAFSREAFMPLQFYDLLYLRIEIGSLNDNLVPAIVNLLRGMPNLISLNIHSNYSIRRTMIGSTCSGFNIDFWKLQDLAFISEIEEVVLKVDHGSNVGGFARYILEHAKNLEKMVIFHYPDQLDTVVNLKSHMISNATISFHELEDPLGKLQEISGALFLN